MKKHPWQLRRFLILFILFVFGIQLFGVKLGTDSASAAKALPQQQAVTPFLYPPNPGSVGENSIFDHTIPTYSQNDQKIVSFTGYEANKDLSVVCPNDPPEPEDPPDCRGVYQSQSLGFRLSYNGHPGIDYDTDYLPIFAAADSDQVIYSGWKYPQDHRGGLAIIPPTATTARPPGLMTTQTGAGGLSAMTNSWHAIRSIWTSFGCATNRWKSLPTCLTRICWHAKSWRSWARRWNSSRELWRSWERRVRDV